MNNLDKEIKYINGKKMKINDKNKLDKYFTKPEVAKRLYKIARTIIRKYDKISEFTWIEPSVGSGSFYKLLPKNKRIGIDIDSKIDNILKVDYLKYEMDKNRRHIIIGNPPFGHRGVMALEFINHSKDAEYVCFILPMFFESKGKGSIKYRVKGFNLIYSEKLLNNSFYTPHNKDAKIQCVFQIWSKHHKLNTKEFSWYNNKNKEPFSNLLKIYIVSLAKNRECGRRYIYNEKADFYVASTFYNDTQIVYNFNDVKYKSAIAVVFQTDDKKKRTKMLDIFKNVNWKEYGSKSTNSCYHLGKSNIYKIIEEYIETIEN